MQKVHAMDFKRIYALCSNSTYFKNERINLYSSRKKSLIPFRDGLCIFFFFKCHRFQRCSYLPSTDGMLSVIIGWFFFFLLSLPIMFWIYLVNIIFLRSLDITTLYTRHHSCVYDYVLYTFQSMWTFISKQLNGYVLSAYNILQC